MIKKIKPIVEVSIEDIELEDPIKDDGDILKIDLIISDDEGEIEDESKNEKARPPRLKKKQRLANSVKAEVIKRMTASDSPIKPQIDKIFTLVSREIKKEAQKKGVPIGNINLDKIVIRR